MSRPMKDSGIYYLSLIPANWGVFKCKRFLLSRMGETLLASDTFEARDSTHFIPVYSATQDNSIFGFVEKANGYYLAIYEGNSIRAKGNNQTVSYNAGEMTSSKTFTVKLIDDNGNVQKDAGNNLLEKPCEVNVKSGFFDKIIALFKGWFNLLPTVEIKPYN